MTLCSVLHDAGLIEELSIVERTAELMFKALIMRSELMMRADRLRSNVNIVPYVYCEQTTT